MLTVLKVYFKYEIAYILFIHVFWIRCKTRTTFTVIFMRKWVFPDF